MQNDPKKRDPQGGQPARKTSFVGRTAAERRAERRGETPAPNRTTGTQPVAAPGSTGRTLDRRAERERERQRQRLFTIIGGVVALIVVVVGLILVTRTPDDAPVPETAQTRYADLVQSRNTDGYPLLGNPTAPVVLTIYSAFDCLACKEFHDQVMDPLVERVRAEQVALEFVPVPGTNEVTNGQGAAIAAVCAAQQNRFWAFHDMLYSWVGQFPNNLAFRNNRIVGGVNALGLDAGAYNGCRGSGVPGEVVQRGSDEARNLLNFAGAPTVAINGVVPLDDENQPITEASAVLAAVDAAIARITGGEGEAVPEVTPEATPDSTPAAVEATPEVTPTAEVTPEVTPDSTPAVLEVTPEVTPEATPNS